MDEDLDAYRDNVSLELWDGPDADVCEWYSLDRLEYAKQRATEKQAEGLLGVKLLLVTKVEL